MILHKITETCVSYGETVPFVPLRAYTHGAQRRVVRILKCTQVLLKKLNYNILYTTKLCRKWTKVQK